MSKAFKVRVKDNAYYIDDIHYGKVVTVRFMESGDWYPSIFRGAKVYKLLTTSHSCIRIKDCLPIGIELRNEV